MLKTFTLKNGIKVATYNLPNLKSVHLRMAAKGGMLVQKKDGEAHLMEHLLVQGIPTLPNAEQFSSYIESLAGTYGASTSQMEVNFEITLPASHLQTAVQICGETFFEALFAKDALERERQVVLTEIKQRADSKWRKITDFFQKSRFVSGHVLTRDLGGTVKTVQKLTLEELISYWEKYFLPENVYLVVVGNFTEKVLEEYLKNYLEKYPPRDDFSGYPQMSSDDFSKEPVSVRFDRTLQSNYLDLTFPGVTLGQKDLRMKQSLALTILGRLRNSRLYRLLRYKKGLVYDVRAGASLLPDLGYVYISSEISSSNLDEVLGLIVSELKGFVQNGPTKEEVEFAKNFLTNQWLMAFDHPSSVAGWIEGELLWEDKVRLPEDIIKQLNSVETEDVLGVMQRYWDFSKLNLTLQGPIRKTPALMKKLEGLVEELKVCQG